MNEYDLFDAMGGIDDDLLLRSESRPVRKIPIRRALIAAAAVMLLAVTAIATPAIREWFFRSNLTQVSDANVVGFPVFGRDEDGNPSEYNAFGYKEAEGRVDLDLDGIGETPDIIHELRVPTYFESGGWEYSPYILYPDHALTWYIGTWQRWTQQNGERIGQYIFYHQKIIYPEAGEYPAGYGQFFIDLGNDAPVERTTLNIDGQEFLVYRVGESELKDLVTFTAHTDVVWSDGEYAYHISTGGMDLDMIADIIRSIAPAEDKDELIRPAVFDTIKTYYTLSNVPEKLTRTEANDHGYYTWQYWNHGIQSIELWQQRIQHEKCDVDNRDLDLTLSDLLADNPESWIEHVEIDGMDVSLLWFQDGDVYAYWTQYDCDFTLCISGYPDINLDDIQAAITSLVPVADFGSLMTD